MSVNREDIRSAIRELGLTGSPVCVHSSLKSFGWVDGGPEAVVESFLEEGCTVLVPTFTSFYMAQAPRGTRIERNSWDIDRPPQPWWITDRAYSVETTEVEEGMGKIPQWIAQMPDRVRGAHPLMSFCAVGPISRELVASQDSEDALAPLDELANREGSVVLIGVGLERMTMLHLAEQRVGRNLFRRWAVSPGGPPIEVAYGGCSDGFGQLMPALEPRMRQKQVGESDWMIFPAKETLKAASAAIKADPLITHCGNSPCRCDDAVLGGPVLD